MFGHGISAFWHAMQCKKAIMYQNIWAKSHKDDRGFSTIDCPTRKPDGAAIIIYNI
jgi:ornithine cyclodeaminase/alanine dehydrogenase-like protein (mu-crystallin family)